MEKHNGAPKSASTLTLDCSPELLEKLDKWIAEQPEPRPDRSGAVKRILADALAGVGDVSIPVDELNASNDE